MPVNLHEDSAAARFVIPGVPRNVTLPADARLLRASERHIAQQTALRSATGGSNAVLREAAYGRLTPLVTPALFLEYESVPKQREQRLVHV